MSCKLKNITRLLCFLFISFFIVGIGGDIVKADSVKVNSRGTLRFRSNTYYQYLETNGKDAFCLNGRSSAPSGRTLTFRNDLVDAKTANKIAAIIAASEDLKLAADQKYYVTQAAIWYVKEGIQQSGTGHPLTQNFVTWLKKNYGSEWETLMKAAQNAPDKASKYTVGLFSSSNKLKDNTNNNGTMISEEINVVTQGFTGKFNVKIVDNASDSSACLQYNDKCEKSITVPAEAKFKIQVNKPSDEKGEVKATITASPEKPAQTYSIKTYGYLSSDGFQNVAVLDTDTITKTSQKVFAGEYKNTTDVKVQKIDKKTNQKVANAHLIIYDSHGSVITTVTSKGEGVEDQTIKLPVGEYELAEITAPKGYASTDERVKFSVKEVNGSLKVQQDGKDVDAATIKIANQPFKVKFKKVDNLGNPVAGAKLTFKDTSMYGANGATIQALVCLISDENGLFTIPCEDKYESVVNKDGIYQLGVDFGSSDGIFAITEEDTGNGYDVEEFNSSSMVGNNYWFHVYPDYSVDTFSRYVSYELSKDEGDVPVLIIKFENTGYVDIGKSDVTTGKEIAGAHLVVSDPSASIRKDEDMGIDNVIDEWTSEEGKKHHITGIAHNHIYELKETISPEGYLSIDTSIYFKVDDKGNVTTYSDKEGTQEIKDLTGTKFELLIPNDYTKVKISKTDMTGAQELEGAEIKICTATEYETLGNECKPQKDSWSWTSTKEPHEIDMMEPGNYCLIETVAPAGYVRKTSAVCFEVYKTGDVQKVQFTNEPNKVIVEKKDYETGNPIGGVTFQIISLDTNEVVREWQSSTDEPQHIEEAVPAGKYKLVETIYPEGYQQNMIVDEIVTTEYEFTISEEDSEILITVYNQAISVPNTGISTLNLFAIGALMIFIGYESINFC